MNMMSCRRKHSVLCSLRMIIVGAFILYWLPVSSFGQTDNTSKGYQKGIEFNYSALAGYWGGRNANDRDCHDGIQITSFVHSYIRSNLSFNLCFVNGYRLNSYLFMGGGIGLSGVFFKEVEHVYFEHYNGEFGSPYNQIFEYEEYSLQIPLFARFQVDFLSKKCSPFFSLDLGGNFCVHNALMDYKERCDLKGNFYGHNVIIRPAVGLKVHFKQNQSLSLAFVYDRTYTPDGETYSQHINHSLGARLGFEF